MFGFSYEAFSLTYEVGNRLVCTLNGETADKRAEH